MLSTGRYLLGVAEIAVLIGAALLGAARLRQRLLAGWTGPPAWLATALLAVAVLLLAAELLGAVGLLRAAPFLVSVVLVGVALRLGVRRPVGDGDDPPAPDRGLGMRLAGLAFLAALVAHFCIGVRLRLSTGMTGFDTTWYHAPFAAGFVQSGSTFDLQFIAPPFLTWFYPHNSELLHGIGLLAFSRDLLSPLINLGWLVGCLVAAWCIGRPFGLGPVSMAGVALALGGGAFADQAGEARNDLPATFFVLTSLAMAINGAAHRRSAPDGPGALGASGGRQRASAPGGSSTAAGSLGTIPVGPLALTGLAAGLAAGTKVNYLAPAIAVVVAMTLLAPRGKRREALAAVGLPALAGCGFWYLRNLVQAGSPLPWLREIGPISVPSPEQEIGGREGFGVIHYLTDPGVWSDWFLPGFEDGFGALWPALIAMSLAGLLLCLGRRAEPVLRSAAVVGLVILAAWLAAPASASGPEGEPLGFVSGLRYLAPAMAVGLALLPLAPPFRSPRAAWILLGAMALALPFVAASGEPWHSAYLAAAIAAGLAVAAVAALIGSGWPASHRGAATAASVAAVLVVVAAGALGQRTYLDNRYANPRFTVPGLDASFRWARSLSGARIATSSTRQYPFFGTDLSNRVRYLGLHRASGGFVSPRNCLEWRRALNDGDYDYLVASRDRFEAGKPRFAPEVGWTASDPAASEVLRLAPTVVFRLDGPLDPDRCRR